VTVPRAPAAPAFTPARTAASTAAAGPVARTRRAVPQPLDLVALARAGRVAAGDATE